MATKSCTEAQVSHVLSKRFSRNPMGWSKKNLGILTKARTYYLSGGEIGAKDFKPDSEERQSYKLYAEEMLKLTIEAALIGAYLILKQPTHRQDHRITGRKTEAAEDD